MTNKEIILITSWDELVYKQILLKATRYALVSVSFTFNRMSKFDIKSRITNIIKGKLAEELFFQYCQDNSIDIEVDECITPFWETDKRDFIYLKGEWDIKNNFITCTDPQFADLDYQLLPALIPNQHIGDQWDKRLVHYIEGSQFVAHLFTFMRLKPEQKSFFSFHLPQQIANLIEYCKIKKQETAYGQMPFEEQWFFDQIDEITIESMLDVHYQPEMIIAGASNKKYWSLFQNTSIKHPWSHDNFNIPKYYTIENNVVKFRDVGLATTIINKTCPLAMLPSFSSILGKI